MIVDDQLRTRRQLAKMHDANIRSNWISSLLERRHRCELLLSGIVHMWRFEHSGETLDALVVAIVEWRTVSKALAVAFGCGAADGSKEGGVAQAVCQLAVELDQIARLCFECVASTGDAATGDVDVDEFNERNQRRNVSEHRRDAGALRSRFAFSVLLQCLSERYTARVDVGEMGVGAQRGECEKIPEPMREGRSGETRVSNWCADFYEDEDDEQQQQQQQQQPGNVAGQDGGIAQSDIEERLFRLYWKCVARTDFLFDDVVACAAAVRAQQSASGGTVESSASGTRGETNERASPLVEATPKAAFSVQMEKEQEAPFARGAARRFYSESRSRAAAPRTPRSYRSLFQAIAPRRSATEISTCGMRSTWVC